MSAGGQSFIFFMFLFFKSLIVVRLETRTAMNCMPDVFFRRFGKILILSCISVAEKNCGRHKNGPRIFSGLPDLRAEACFLNNNRAWHRSSQYNSLNPKYFTDVSLSVITFIFAVITHRIHVWYIFTYIWLKLVVNVGKHTIHGWYGVIILRCQILLGQGIDWFQDKGDFIASGWFSGCNLLVVKPNLDLYTPPKSNMDTKHAVFFSNVSPASNMPPIWVSMLGSSFGGVGLWNFWFLNQSWTVPSHEYRQ